MQTIEVAHGVDRRLVNVGRRRGVLAIAACVLLLWGLMTLARPREASVNGRSIAFGPGDTVADCARAAGIGLPPEHASHPVVSLITYLNGQRCEPGTRARTGDSIVVSVADGSSVEYVGYVATHGLPAALYAASPDSPEPPEPRGPKRPRVALTFDDGPHRRFTPAILDTLASHRVRATFFVLGELVTHHPELVRRMAQEGHEVGLHSWNHPNFTKLSASAAASQLERSARAVEPLVASGLPVRWFRPPYGAIDARSRGVAKGMGYGIAMWTMDTSDWRRPGSEAIYSRAVRGARDGSIILMHDGGGDRAGTVAAVARIVPELQRRGFELVTLSELKGERTQRERPQVVFTENGMLEVTPVGAGFSLVIDGAPVALSAPAVRLDGQLMLPLSPVLERLGAELLGGSSEQTGGAGDILTLRTQRGTLTLELNARRARLEGRELVLRVPAIRYQGVAVAPVWLIANVCRAQVAYDAHGRVLRLTSFGARGRALGAATAVAGGSAAFALVRTAAG